MRVIMLVSLVEMPENVLREVDRVYDIPAPVAIGWVAAGLAAMAESETTAMAPSELAIVPAAARRKQVAK
jgi:hypothetical protein